MRECDWPITLQVGGQLRLEFTSIPQILSPSKWGWGDWPGLLFGFLLLLCLFSPPPIRSYLSPDRCSRCICLCFMGLFSLVGVTLLNQTHVLAFGTFQG